VYIPKSVEQSRETDAAPGATPDSPAEGDRPLLGKGSTMTHAPAPRVVVEEDVRSVVLSAEVDEDRTPPRGTSTPSAEEPAPVSRELSPYSRSGETTQKVDPKRRSAAGVGARRGLSPEVGLAIVAIVTALLLLAVIGWMVAGGREGGRASPAPTPSGTGSAPTRTRDLDAAEPPVDLADLPVERN